MTTRSYATTAALLCCLSLGAVLHASSFLLGHDPDQIFNSTNVGPYPGSLTGSTATNFFCLDYTLTSTFGVNYVGAVAVPTTEQEEEAAFLGAYAIYQGSPSSTPSAVKLIEGPISFAIWQIMGTLGTTSPDPTSRQYVQTAQFAYSHNLIPQAFLNTTLIFKPNDNGIQRFITAVPDSAMVSTVLDEVPEPPMMALIGLTLAIFGLAGRKLALQVRAR